MKTQTEVKTYALNAYDSKNIYVWGMNGEEITKESIAKAFKNCGSPKYNKAYYDAKLQEGLGKHGADCSGFLFPLSGKDRRAVDYCSDCKKTGMMTTLPIDKVVLLFSGATKKTISHVGIYLGDGRCVHMQNSTKNIVMQNVTEYPWDYWGIPDWIDYDAPFENYTDKYTWDKFIVDVGKALGCMSYNKLLMNTITVSQEVNRGHLVVTALERCLKALGYYNGVIEADNKQRPIFGSGMAAAVKQYQKEVVKANAKGQDGIITAKAATWKKLLGLS